MDKTILKILIIFTVVITSGLIYRFGFYTQPIEHSIVLNEEFTLNVGDKLGLKDDKNSSIEITRIGASLEGYVFDYLFKIDGKEYNKNNINESKYEVKLISSDYKTQAKLLIIKKTSNN